jgi:glycerate-2-kinase
VFAAGATIEEINTVRKHISDIRGGGLARLAYPATVLSLIISDTPGCSMDMVASGPTLPDPTTIQDARAVLKKYSLPLIVLTETPKEKKYFTRVHHMLLLCNMDALNAMHHAALALGYRVRVIGNALFGEARTIAERHIRDIGRREALIGGGETTVTLKGRGKGGRNQEVVLGALPLLGKGMVIVSINSDGLDNTEAAGAIADEKTLVRARKKKLVPARFLKNNDAYHFFERLDDLIMTGPTGTNVSDLFLCLKE